MKLFKVSAFLFVSVGISLQASIDTPLNMTNVEAIVADSSQTSSRPVETDRTGKKMFVNAACTDDVCLSAGKYGTVSVVIYSLFLFFVLSSMALFLLSSIVSMYVTIELSNIQWWPT